MSNEIAELGVEKAGEIASTIGDLVKENPVAAMAVVSTVAITACAFWMYKISSQVLANAAQSTPKS